MARLQQLVLALVFLTRMPLGRFLPPKVLPLSQSAWAFPLAGALVGAVASLPLLIFGQGALPATLSVALAVWFTGALHEDALADFADAAGGNTREDRLRIMGDSRIGSYGAMALILVTALRITAIATLGPLALIAAAATGRTAIVVAMKALPPARTDGLGRGAGRPSGGQVATALILAALPLLALAAPMAILCAVIAALAAAGFVIARAHRLLGGQTGDVLGAVSLATETAILVALALTGVAISL